VQRVSLAYWSESNNPNNLIMQPIYVFSGTSTTYENKEEPFNILVQANKIK